ncbi:MAG: SulP family inorganic anion transporter [Candidatus Nanopelagicales bacterium]
MAGQWRSEFRVFPTLRGYRRSWLTRDLLAGLSFGAITIPGQLATAHLAGMPTITGLYGFLAACLMAAMFAANRHLALGMDSTIAPMLAAGLVSVGVVAGTEQYVGLALVTTLIVGVLLLIVGIGKMGWVGDFLSRPVVTGFLGGIAIIIVINQLPQFFGIQSTFERTPARLLHFLQHVSAVNVPTLIVGVASLALLLIFSRIGGRFPGALVVLVLAIATSAIFDLSALGVQTLGPLKSGLPSLTLPPLTFDSIELTMGTALAIAIICMAQTSATTRTSAAVGGFETDINADFRSVGAANVLSSFFGAFTANASPPSTAIIAESRGRTQATALFASVLAVILMFASRLIEALPEATLSAILIFIAIRIFHLDEMIAMKHYSWRAFSLMLTAMLGVVILGVGYGVGLAVLISVLDRARRTARPELLRLGRTPEGQWVKRSASNSEEVPGVAVFRLNGPLWFGNANWFREEMLAAIPEDSEKPDLLVLDTTGVDDIDFTGNNAVIQVAELCELRTVELAIVTHPGKTDRAFHKGGLIDDIGQDRVFESVEAAVVALDPEVDIPFED